MMEFTVAKEYVANFVVETKEYSGVKRIAEIVAGDVELVCGCKPAVKNKLEECDTKSVVLAASVGNSEVIEKLVTKNKMSIEEIVGKREVYKIQRIEQPFEEYPNIQEILVIVGSDKRGTIYGLFRLSEMCGVSPLVFWGDAAPTKRDELLIEMPERYLSKEPSVKYRGFFINDEWPAFGNWCTEKFGGINAAAYEKIFELLLRLKGNYLWPAMWRSSFSEDGPGLANDELANELGVIMGKSHHEPMNRSGVEWQNQYEKYGEDSTWSFISNEQAITKFWEEGIIRNKPYETVVTIGMRGENDSKLMPEDATLKDNIGVIKKAIRVQNQLLRKNICEDLKKVPRMLAIYKEVEDYYFGDETCEGLKDWEELEDVIFLLSDDNYGQLRSLPTEETKNHPGGYGMYYHFDYHGAPTSYEWTNCNRLTKTWEQMTQAYESGVREMWIVNVGDLKEVEYPLCYFMDLAYDYETWGISAINKTEQYVEKWLDVQFGNRLDENLKEKMKTLIEGYTRWNHNRSPEAMRTDIYHWGHYYEGDRVYQEVSELIEIAEQLEQDLSGEDWITYNSMIYYPAVASLNLILMYVEAGMNKELSKRGCIYANYYAENVKMRIREDKRLVKEFHEFQDGKWNHCLSSAHTGFREWDDKDWTYPTVSYVEPISGGKSVVSFRGSEMYHLGAHWQDTDPLMNDDFTRMDASEVLLDLDSRGDTSYTFQIQTDCEWLKFSQCEGRVEVEKNGRNTIAIGIHREKIQGAVAGDITVWITFDNGEKTYSKVRILAENKRLKGTTNSKTFVEKQGWCAIPASEFVEAHETDEGKIIVVDYLGREGSAIKALPAMKSYENPSKAPFVKYSFWASKAGKYMLDLHLVARNPVVKGERMRFWVSLNEEEPQQLYGVSEQYYTEWFNEEWAQGVLSHARVVKTPINIKEGFNDIYFYAGDPGVILEKLVCYPADSGIVESYLGPTISERV